jgi:hypothetical protein
MSALSVNLKMLFQRTIFWVWWFVLGIFALLSFILFDDGNVEGYLFFSLLMSFCTFGTFVGETSRDILASPFSFCLPRYNIILRYFLFVAGLIPCLLWAMIFLFYPASDFRETFLLCLNIFLTATIFYWLGVSSVLKSPLIVLGIIAFLCFSKMFVNFEQIVLKFNTPLMAMGILTNALAWLYFGKRGLSRKCCGTKWLGFTNSWDANKVQRTNRAMELEKMQSHPKGVESRINALFLRQIEKYKPGDLRQYLWGGLYRSMGIGIPRWMKHSIVFLIYFFLLVFTMKFLEFGVFIFFFMFNFIMVSIVDIRSNLLVAGGRKERFWSSIFVALFLVALNIAVLIMSASCVNLLISLMPDLTEPKYSESYNRYVFNPFFIAEIILLIVPLLLTGNLLRQINHTAPLFILGATLISVYLFCVFGTHNFIIQYFLICVDILSWALFIVILRYLCMRCSLIK